MSTLAQLQRGCASLTLAEKQLLQAARSLMGFALGSSFGEALTEGLEIEDVLGAVSAVSQKGMQTTYEDSFVMMKSTELEECLDLVECLLIFLASIAGDGKGYV